MKHLPETPRTNALIAEFSQPGGIVKADRLRAMSIALVDLARDLEAGSTRVVPCRATEALRQLVVLKAAKDRLDHNVFPKDHLEYIAYLKAKPEAWAEARAVLNVADALSQEHSGFVPVSDYANEPFPASGELGSVNLGSTPKPEIPPEAGAAIRYLLLTYSDLHREAVAEDKPFVEVATGNMPQFLNALRHAANTIATPSKEPRS